MVHTRFSGVGGNARCESRDAQRACGSLVWRSVASCSRSGFHGRVRSIAIRVTDVNRPRGDFDKVCRVTVNLTAPKRVLIIEDADVDAAVAIDRVADRTARTVARAVDTLGDEMASRRR